MRAAVIGIGSNSVRLLVGDMCGGETKQVLRDREGTRLFAGLTEDGCLEEEAIRVTADAVRRMAETAREQKAETLQVFATSAARDAVNGSVFCRMTLIPLTSCLTVSIILFVAPIATKTAIPSVRILLITLNSEVTTNVQQLLRIIFQSL
jgi:hypothetical protein